MCSRILLACSVIILGLSNSLSPAFGANALVATATNFTETAQRLRSEFEAAHTEHSITLVTGSTGKLFAQITNGAPFDLFLAADQVRPKKLEDTGFGVTGTRFTYASGLLYLWSADPDLISTDGAKLLGSGTFRKLAIANPKLAPYGVAASQVLDELELNAQLNGRIVMGENVAQTHALVASGNAELGFIAKSLLVRPETKQHGSYWQVPAKFYDPIRQDGVLLERAKKNEAAIAFHKYLKSDKAKAIMRENGFEVH